MLSVIFQYSGFSKWCHLLLYIKVPFDSAMTGCNKILLPLAVDFLNVATASGSRLFKHCYCHCSKVAVAFESGSRIKSGSRKGCDPSRCIDNISTNSTWRQGFASLFDVNLRAFRQKLV